MGFRHAAQFSRLASLQPRHAASLADILQDPTLVHFSQFSAPHPPSAFPQVMHHPDLGHGGILLAPEWQAQFVANLRAMLAARR